MTTVVVQSLGIDDVGAKNARENRENEPKEIE
jgi:hypothetical protein